MLVQTVALPGQYLLEIPTTKDAEWEKLGPPNSAQLGWSGAYWSSWTIHGGGPENKMCFDDK